MKFISAVMLSVFAVCVYGATQTSSTIDERTSSSQKITADSKILRVNASTPEKMQESFVLMLTELDGVRQQSFAAAMATIGVYYMQDESLGGQASMKDALHGKTADEVIALSRKLAPHLKRNSEVLDGSSRDAFGKSVGELLVSLPEKKQIMFSEALAKLMYENTSKGGKEEDIMKKLDGKRPEEVIELALGVKTPFEKNGEYVPQDYSLRKLDNEEIKRRNLPLPATKTKPSEADFNPELDLSPASILKK